MSLKLYKEQYQMLEKIAAEMHNANVKMAVDAGSSKLGSSKYQDDAFGAVDPYAAVDPHAAATATVRPPSAQVSVPTPAPKQQQIPVVHKIPSYLPENVGNQPRGSYPVDAIGQLEPSYPDPAWHAAITDPIRRAAGWVDDHAQSLGGLTGAEAPWLKRTLGYGAPALGAAALGAGAYALANRGGGDPQQGQESLASADLYNAIRQLQAENAEFRAYFQKQASAQTQAPAPTSVNELSLDEKRAFFKQASPDQQNQMFVDEVVKTASAMLTVNGLENGSNPFDPLVIREAAVDLLRSKGYKV